MASGGVIQAQCGCIGLLNGNNFTPTTFNCRRHKIGAKYVFTLQIRKARTTVSVKSIKPHLDELLLRCGDVKETANYSGLTTATIQRIQKNHYKTVQLKTARKIMDALLSKREDDRKNYNVNDKLIRAKREQAKQEAKLRDLTGY